MISILIVDDHLVLRYGLKQILKEEYRDIVFGEAGASAEALRKAAKNPAKNPWDLVILALRLGGEDTFPVLSEIRKRHPDIKILIFSMYLDPRYAIRALELGASGYLSKDASRSQLMQAVRRVMAGNLYVSPAMRKKIAVLPPALERPSPKDLSPREQQVQRALASGKQPGEIAAELRLSIKTVSTYKRRILDKLGLKSTADLVRYMIDRGR